jgi:hypothetical protein
MSKQLQEIWEMSVAWMVTFMLFGGLAIVGLPLSYFLVEDVPQTFIEEAGGQETTVYIDPSAFDPKAEELVITEPLGVENPIETGDLSTDEAVAQADTTEDTEVDTDNNAKNPSKAIDALNKSTAKNTPKSSQSKKVDEKKSPQAKKTELAKNTIKKGSKLRGKQFKRTKVFNPRSKDHRKVLPKTTTWSSKGKGEDKRNRCIPSTNKRIKQLGENEYQVARSIVKPFMYNPVKANKLARAKWSVNRKNQKVGVKLTRLRCKSPLHLLGLKKGDVILSVNGKKVNSNMRALKAYNKA